MKVSLNTKVAVIPNFVLLVLTFLLLNILYKKNAGYNFVIDSNLKGNLQFIKENPNLSTREKDIAKYQADANFLYYIVDNTPKDAVILMPKAEDIQKANFKTSGGGLYHAFWCGYYGYPRKFVYENEKGQNPFFEKATHVAIINGAGYNNLKYEVSAQQKQVQFAILPITQP